MRMRVRNRPGVMPNPAPEDQLLGASEIEVLVDHLLEERAAVLRLVEHRSTGRQDRSSGRFASRCGRRGFSPAPCRRRGRRPHRRSGADGTPSPRPCARPCGIARQQCRAPSRSGLRRSLVSAPSLTLDPVCHAGHCTSAGKGGVPVIRPAARGPGAGALPDCGGLTTTRRRGPASCSASGRRAARSARSRGGWGGVS